MSLIMFYRSMLLTCIKLLLSFGYSIFIFNLPFFVFIFTALESTLDRSVGWHSSIASQLVKIAVACTIPQAQWRPNFGFIEPILKQLLDM